MKPVQKTYSVTEARQRMERYCAYRERCHKEVLEKLREMRMIPAAVDQIMLHLLQENYLNETRFAQAFARGKFRIKKWGKNRIVRELKMRDISQYNIKMAMMEIPDDAYLDTFDALATARWEQLDSEENIQRKKKKFADYLLYRGWESTMIWERIKELTN
ncbi:MAG: regulatory protein RecX [Bacteroidota bacterium]